MLSGRSTGVRLLQRSRRKKQQPGTSVTGLTRRLRSGLLFWRTRPTTPPNLKLWLQLCTCGGHGVTALPL